MKIHDPLTGKLHLKPGREKSIHNRHPWLFSGAVDRVEGEPQPGDLVAVHDRGGNFLAIGYYNPHSQIRVRILSWDSHQPIDDTFWRERIQRAYNGRADILTPKTTACRLINAEADLLPGLIVDQYGEYVVMQCATMGIDRRKDLLIHLLANTPMPTGRHPLGIIERSDLAVREKEGLSSAVGMRWGEPPSDEIVIREHGLQFKVNLIDGHKTGFYLDQRYNRQLLRQDSLVSGKEMLNVFAYTGGFAVYAAKAKAAKITNIDSSIPALEMAERNVLMNMPTRTADEYLAGDAFEILRDYRHEGRQYDIIVLDPPKFAHSKRDVDAATRGYKDINLLGMQLLRPGGLLMTFSCSGHIDLSLFQKVLFGAAVDAERDVQIVRTLTQAADHPTLLSFPESAYLKGFMCRVW